MLDKIQKKNSSSVNSSETSEFQEYIMDLEPKIKKQIAIPYSCQRYPEHHATSEAECCTPVRSCWSKFFASDLELICWNGRENLTYGFLFLQKWDCFGKRQLFSKKRWLVDVGCVGHPCEIFRKDNFFQILVPKECRQRTPYPLSSRQWPWCRTGRSVHPVGCAGKNKSNISVWYVGVYRVRLMRVSGSQEIHIGNSFRITHATTNSGLSFNPTSKSFSLSLV